MTITTRYFGDVPTLTEDQKLGLHTLEVAFECGNVDVVPAVRSHDGRRTLLICAVEYRDDDVHLFPVAELVEFDEREGYRPLNNA